jgi:hypothetical protein
LTPIEFKAIMTTSINNDARPLWPLELGLDSSATFGVRLKIVGKGVPPALDQTSAT